jgi:RimJ/RimL family protein N-acetyltransferase
MTSAPPIPEDLDALAAMHADPAVMRYLGNGRPRSRAETWQAMERYLGQWALRGYGTLAIQDSAGRLVGRTGIYHPLEWPEPELAYSLARPFWGMGLASEAAGAMRDWAFATRPFAHLASFIRPDNAASIRVAARLGATLDGIVPIGAQPAQRWVHHRPGHGPVA